MLCMIMGSWTWRLHALPGPSIPEAYLPNATLSAPRSSNLGTLQPRFLKWLWTLRPLESLNWEGKMFTTFLLLTLTEASLRVCRFRLIVHDFGDGQKFLIYLRRIRKKYLFSE